MNSTNYTKRDISDRVFFAFNSANINYSVVHGLENYPDSIGRDIDVLIEKNDIEKCISVLENELISLNLNLKKHKTTWGHYYLFTYNNNCKNDSACLILEIDLIPFYQWAATTFLTKPETIIYVGNIYKVDLWASFLKRVLFQILGGNTQKFQKKNQELDLSLTEIKIIKKKLPLYLGKDLAEILIQSILKKDLKSIVELTPRIRRYVAFTGIKNPISFAFGIKNWLLNEIAHLIPKRCAPIIAIVGPDGVGKSTIIKEISILLPEKLALPEIIVRHWRPGVLPNLGTFIGRKHEFIGGSDAVVPRRKPGYFGVLRALYYFMDFLVGGWIKDRRDSSTLKTVLYDRCALDMIVDPVRYGIKSSKVSKFIWKFTTKPDLVVLLKDDPYNIYSRKPELSIVEIERQYKEWGKILCNGDIDYIAQINEPPKIIANKIVNLILEKFFNDHQDQ